MNTLIRFPTICWTCWKSSSTHNRRGESVAPATTNEKREKTMHAESPWTAEQVPDRSRAGYNATIYSQSGSKVAKVYGWFDADNVANRNLITAAPDLLAACQDALATGERDMQHILDNGRLRDVLRSAIASATAPSPVQQT